MTGTRVGNGGGRGIVVRMAPGTARGTRNVDDKRQYPRTDVEDQAYVSFGGTSLGCTIRNISEEGAAIDVENASYLPERFLLVMEPDHEVRNCRMVWIKQNRIGVQFES